MGKKLGNNIGSNKNNIPSICPTILKEIQTLSETTLQRRIKAFANKLSQRSLILLISPLDGSQITTLLDNMPNDCTVVSIVFSEIHIQEYNSLNTKLNSTFPQLAKIPMLFQDAIESQLQELIAKKFFHSIELLYYSNEAYRYSEQAQKLLNKCQIELKQTWANHATTSYFGMRWMKNLMHNCNNSSLSFGIPKSINNNKVAIVIGAGPSLNLATLEFIKNNQNNVVIFAADTALPTLNHYGIYPQYCALLEGQFYNMQDFIPKPHPNITAIGDICSYPASLRAFNTASCISSRFSSISLFSEFNKHLPPIIPPLGSVGVLALFLAIQSEIQHILIAGLDFSFYKGKSHSINTHTYNTWHRTHDRTSPWNQASAHFPNTKLMQTNFSRFEDKTMQMFRKKLERTLLPLAKQMNITCYDLNHESIIEGLEIISLENAKTLISTSSTINDNNIHFSNDIFLPKSIFLQFPQNNTTSNHPSPELLTVFLEQCKITKLRMKELMSQQLFPNEEDWNSGLDNFTFMLPDDPYLLRNSIQYWNSNNIYTKVYVTAQTLENEIQSIQAINTCSNK